MDTLLEAMLASPLLPKQVDRLVQVLAEERPRRERFYEEMTEDGKWEFINGETIMHSPAKLRHVEVAKRLLVLLDAHVNKYVLGLVAPENLLISLTRNDYQPDICFFRKDATVSFDSDQMRFPAPDFIAEVLSPSTARRDRGIKQHDYAAHGVSEYWLVDPVARTVEQYGLHGDDYQLAGIWKDTDEISSSAVNGFCIPVLALFDQEANFTVLLALVNKPRSL